jgi:competence protein ComEC
MSKQFRYSLAAEVDVLILPHHGADNGFTNEDLLRHLNPAVAVCSSNYDNQYDHPRDSVRSLLYGLDIPLFTTKTGDCVIEGYTTGEFVVLNLGGDSTQILSRNRFRSKRRS